MRQTKPFVSWALSVIMAGILIYELVYNDQKQGSIISLKVRLIRKDRIVGAVSVLCSGRD